MRDGLTTRGGNDGGADRCWDVLSESRIPIAAVVRLCIRRITATSLRADHPMEPAVMRVAELMTPGMCPISYTAAAIVSQIATERRSRRVLGMVVFGMSDMGGTCSSVKRGSEWDQLPVMAARQAASFEARARRGREPSPEATTFKVAPSS